jgi:hypothetical protein
VCSTHFFFRVFGDRAKTKMGHTVYLWLCGITSQTGLPESVTSRDGTQSLSNRVHRVRIGLHGNTCEVRSVKYQVELAQALFTSDLVGSQVYLGL